MRELKRFIAAQATRFPVGPIHAVLGGACPPWRGVRPAARNTVRTQPRSGQRRLHIRGAKPTGRGRVRQLDRRTPGEPSPFVARPACGRQPPRFRPIRRSRIRERGSNRTHHIHIGPLAEETHRVPASSSCGPVSPSRRRVFLVENAVSPLSDTVFVLFVLLALIGMERFLNEGTKSLLAWAAVWAALACLTRYPGVTVILAAVLLLALDKNAAMIERAKRIAGLFVRLGNAALPVVAPKPHAHRRSRRP